MYFCGVNGITACVKGVMFCENVHSTLISPLALRQAKLTINYHSNTDVFLFKSPCGVPLIKSPMDSRRQSWLFP
jgi:hypothetical protein